MNSVRSIQNFFLDKNFCSLEWNNQNFKYYKVASRKLLSNEKRKSKGK